jgi:hypothetical protein
MLVSHVNGLSYQAGRFSTPSLAELRGVAASVGMLTEAGATIKGRTSLVVEHLATRDIFELHNREEYAGATFMAASQFNCLEFPHPDVTPEQGVTNYVYDGTQGPACALAAPAATVARNYFVPTNGRVGQTADNQLNNLAELLASLRPTADEEGDLEAEELVRVRNGYTMSDTTSLTALNGRIASAPSRDALLGRLRIGLHENVEVPWGPRRFDFIEASSRQRVSQTFCSALSCGCRAALRLLCRLLCRRLSHLCRFSVGARHPYRDVTPMANQSWVRHSGPTRNPTPSHSQVLGRLGRVVGAARADCARCELRGDTVGGRSRGAARRG